MLFLQVFVIKEVFFILDIIEKILDTNPDPDIALQWINQKINQNYVTLDHFQNQVDLLSKQVDELKNQNKSIIFKNFLENNGCLEPDFISYSQREDIDKFIDFDDNEKNIYLESIKKAHPFVFKQNRIGGNTPPESFDLNSEIITKDDFSKMSYFQKVNLFENNKSLYDSFV